MKKTQSQWVGVSSLSHPLPEKDKGKPFTVDLYVRVSTFSQLEGDSLEEQESELRKFCDYRGFNIHRMYCEEAKSGGNTRRPEYQKLIADIENRRVDAVVVKKLDRLSRSLLDFEQLMVLMQRHEVEFMSLRENFDTTTAMGKAMLRMALVFAQLEREQTSERVTDVMTFRATQGLRNGGVPPFGYRVVEKELVVYPKEKNVVELVFKQFIDSKSTILVARFLNDLGFKNRQNKSWDCRRILDMLRNSTYKGDTRWRGQLFPGTHVPIISPQTFENVQLLLKSRGVVAKSDAILQKLLVCGHCRVPMTTNYAINRSKVRYYYYLCTSAATNRPDSVSSCPDKRVPLHSIQDAVIAYICSLTYETVFQSLANRIDKHNSAISFQEKEMAFAVGVLHDELQKLKVRKDRYFDSLMTQSLLSNERKMGNERLKELDGEERQLKAKLHKLEFEKSTLSESKIDATEFRRSLETFATQHEKWSSKQCHMALRQLIQKVWRNTKTLTIQFKLFPWTVDIPFEKNLPPP